HVAFLAANSHGRRQVAEDAALINAFKDLKGYQRHRQSPEGRPRSRASGSDRRVRASGITSGTENSPAYTIANLKGEAPVRRLRSTSPPPSLWAATTPLSSVRRPDGSRGSAAAR